jgi:hypothetical protein
MLDVDTKNWYRENYLVSTAPSLVQLDEVNKAFNSDVMWWAQSLSREKLKKALGNSLCLGLYELPQSTVDIAGGLFNPVVQQPIRKLTLGCRPKQPKTDRFGSSGDR